MSSIKIRIPIACVSKRAFLSYFFILLLISPVFSVTESSWYPINESSGTIINDIGISGLDGTLSNALAWETGGKIWDATTDFGGSYHIDVASSNLSSTYSLSFWVKPNTISGTQGIFYLKDVSDSIGIYTSGTDNTINGQIYDGSAHKCYNTIYTGNWYHVVIIFDDTGNNIKGYINGTAFTTQNTDSWSMVSDDNIVLGDEDGGSWKSNLNLQDFRVYHKVLSTDEIDWLYNNGNGRDCSLSYYPLVCPSDKFGKYNATLITDNSTSHFFKYNNTGDVNFNSFNGSGASLSGLQMLNMSSSSLGVSAENFTSGEDFELSFNNYSEWIHNLVVNNFYNGSVEKSVDVFSTAYNLSGLVYNPTLPSGDSQFFNVSVGERVSGTGQVVNVSIKWNGTTYFMSEWSDNEWSWGNTPSINGIIETISFTTFVNVSYGGEMLNYTNTSSQVITTIELDDCGVFSNQLLNISLRNERNRDFLIPNSSVRANFDISDSLLSVEITDDSDGIFGICLNNSVSFLADVDFSFWVNNNPLVDDGDETLWGAETKKEREHFYFSNPFNSTTIQQRFFKLEEDYAEKIIFNLVDSTQQALSGYYITLKRWYGTGYEVVAMAKTDVNGQAITYVEFNDPYYAFDIRDGDGNLVYSTDRIILTTTPTTIVVPTSSSLDYFSVLDEFSFSNIWNNGTGYFSSTMINLNGVDSVFTLLVYYSNGSLVCSRVSGSTSSYTTSCLVGGWSNSSFFVNGRASVNGQSVLLFNYLIDDTSNVPVFGATEGIIWLFFIMVVLCLFFVGISPTFLPLAPALSLLFTNLLGITTISVFVIGGLATIGVVFMLWFMKS